MTEKKTVAKKTTPKKTAAKKVAVEKVETQEVEVVEKAKPVRNKRIEIDRNDMIPCRSVTNGTLVYISDRTKARFLWSEYGVVQYIDMGELLDMRASQPKLLNDVMIVIDDEEAVQYLGLTEKYESLANIDDLDSFFAKSEAEMKKILPKLPNGIKQSIATHARKLIDEGELGDLNKIRILDEHLKTHLKVFLI